MGALTLSYAERRDWLRLSRSENVGPVTFRSLLDHYDSVSDALAALPELSAKGGRRRPIRIYDQERAEADLERADELGARFVAWGEPDYPALLHHIDGSPPLICIKGDADVLGRPVLGIVGARNASALGRKLTRKIAGELGEAGFTVVSGLARGIDTAAHQGSLETGTVAVLAGGIDNIYPPENEDLYHDIARRGLLVSEHTVGTKPQAQHFPRRNRLVSGMSYGVLVVEAALRSGSLITARLALEQNREVFAVPGTPMDPRAEGTNKLIKDGAVLVQSARDITDVITPMLSPTRPSSGHSRTEQASDTRDAAHCDLSTTDRNRLLDLIGSNAVNIDDLIRESGLDASAVMIALLELELAGSVERLPQQKVARSEAQ